MAAGISVGVRRRGGLRTLGLFWGVLVVALAAGAGVLEWLGPPPPDALPEALHTAEVAAPAVATAVEPARFGPPAPELPRQATPVPAAPLATGAPIPGPLPGLLDPVIGSAPAGLPRIGADGRASAQAYAAGTDAADTRPRVAILFGGIGLSAADSDEAVRALPAAVSFVVSPYAAKPERLLADMRARGHEFLLALPMESQDFPASDAGNQALLTGAAAEQNGRRLDWAMSRFAGYVGVTNAADGQRGERFAASSQMGAVLQTLSQRGLLYVDTGPVRPAASPRPLVARGIDLVLDEPAVRTEIDAKLARLEQIARQKGVAVGLASLPRPVTIDRLAAWTFTLSGRGVALVPVSAAAASQVRPQ